MTLNLGFALGILAFSDRLAGRDGGGKIVLGFPTRAEMSPEPVGNKVCPGEGGGLHGGAHIPDGCARGSGARGGFLWGATIAAERVGGRQRGLIMVATALLLPELRAAGAGNRRLPWWKRFPE
jgi:hypothetical protein